MASSSNKARLGDDPLDPGAWLVHPATHGAPVRYPHVVRSRGAHRWGCSRPDRPCARGSVVSLQWKAVRPPPPEPSLEDLLNQASNLDTDGEWEKALAIYEHVATRLHGQQEGEYARNCAREVREKIAQSKGGAAT